MKTLNIEKLVDHARYSEDLQTAIDISGGAVEVLRLNYESSYQGFVDIDVLLSNGKVFSYEYSYGSCSGCDTWEAKDFSSNDVVSEMLQEATIFDSKEHWENWRQMVRVQEEERRLEAERRRVEEKKQWEEYADMVAKGDVPKMMDYMKKNVKPELFSEKRRGRRSK